ncbi:hypothetical protein CEXT_613451 [Caerostris extrusa]|uniref:Uncharacterized protein n=1 Tax=Caerostris extrusa TaxID=172846 RepID=A0AAV4R6Q9_CAEEX|nr:hypothetical protein CEXT_613451 [Caerostris extrusa]
MIPRAQDWKESAIVTSKFMHLDHTWAEDNRSSVNFSRYRRSITTFLITSAMLTIADCCVRTSLFNSYEYLFPSSIQMRRFRRRTALIGWRASRGRNWSGEIDFPFSREYRFP